MCMRKRRKSVPVSSGSHRELGRAQRPARNLRNGQCSHDPRQVPGFDDHGRGRQPVGCPVDSGGRRVHDQRAIADQVSMHSSRCRACVLDGEAPGRRRSASGSASVRIVLPGWFAPFFAAPVFWLVACLAMCGPAGPWPAGCGLIGARRLPDRRVAASPSLSRHANQEGGAWSRL